MDCIPYGLNLPLAEAKNAPFTLEALTHDLDDFLAKNPPKEIKAVPKSQGI
jgi:hypothetical protein